MSREYAEGKIKDAIAKAGGNAAQARQFVISWAQEDPKLLFALTKGHLSGIAAYNIERIMAGRSTAEAVEETVPVKAPEEENFGKEILKAVAGDGGALFGLEPSGTPRSAARKKASKQHIDAIRQMTAGTTPIKKTTDQ